MDRAPAGVGRPSARGTGRPGRSRGTQIGFRRLVEQAPDIIYRFGLHPPRVEYVNSAVDRVLGVSPDALYADPELAFRLVDPTGAAEASAVPTSPDEVRPATLRWQRLDGTVVALENHPVAIVDRRGHLQAVEGIARDVSEKVQAEQALQRTQRELDAVLGGAPVIIWAVDAAGVITLAQGAGLTAIRRSGDQLVGRRVDELGPAGAELRRHLDRGLRGERFHVDLELVDRVFATVVAPLRDGQSAIQGAIGVSTDVTAERALEAATARERRERAVVELAIERLDPNLGLDGLATSIATEVVKLVDVDRVSLLSFGPRGLVFVVATDGLRVSNLESGQRLPAARARYLRARARQGPWVEAWEPREIDGTYGLSLSAAGINGVAYQPLRAGRATVGLLVLSTRQPAGVAALERHLSAFAAMGSLVSARLGPALGERARFEIVRSEIRGVIARRRFGPVFQPIVALEDGEVVGYEALTRFDDGTPPERRFAEASAVGLSSELERATLVAALEAACALPDALPLALNVSPALVLDSQRLSALLANAERPVTIELSEHEQIDDYRGLRAALDAMPRIRWSIDDAGAGFASLRHCIELGPHDIKLDRSLVAGADRDPARLAAIVGFQKFADQVGARLIAEGIETEAERTVLREIGVRFGQGYLFGRPHPVET